MTKYRALGKHFVPGHWTSMCIPIVVVGIWGEREIRIVSKGTMLLVSLGSNSLCIYLMAKGRGNSWLFWWSNYLEEKTHPSPSNLLLHSFFFLPIVFYSSVASLLKLQILVSKVTIWPVTTHWVKKCKKL